MPGFSVILKGAGTDPKYCCSSCGKLLDEPRQTECGHRYCRTCLEDLTRTGEDKCTAHKCGETIKPGVVFPDKAIEREVGSIPVVCNNVKDGCEWEGVVKQVKDHLSQCDYERIPCIHEAQGCQKSIRRKGLATHLQEECDFRTDACQWCKSTFSHNCMKEHQKSCPSAPAKCDWCGKKGLTRVLLQEHQHPETGSCPNMKIPCNFTPAGCKEMMEKKHLHEHQKKSTSVHLNMLQALVLQLASNFEQHRGQEVESRESMRLHLPQLQKAIQDLESKLVQMERKIASDQSERATASGSTDVKALENRIEQLTGKLEEVVKKLAAWEPRIGTLEEVEAFLNREIEKCSSQMNPYERQRRQDREIIETLERKVSSLERIIALKDVALAEQDLRIQTSEPTSYDGIPRENIPCTFTPGGCMEMTHIAARAEGQDDTTRLPSSFPTDVAEQLLSPQVQDNIHPNGGQQYRPPAADANDNVMQCPEQQVDIAPRPPAAAPEQETTDPEVQRGRIIELQKKVAMLESLVCVLLKDREILSRA